MMKLELHWQILIALILGVLYGIFFAPSFEFTDESIKKIIEQNITKEQVVKLKSVEDIEFVGRAKFENKLRNILGQEKSEIFKNKIIRHAKTINYGEYKIWKINTHTVSSIEKENVPKSIIENLHNLKTIEYKSSKAFTKDLSKKIGVNNAVRYSSAIIKQAEHTNRIKYVSWLGSLFMRALKMVIIPLILTSIISGVANIGSAENLGRLGLKTMTYYMLTSVLAIVTGLFFVNMIKPGIGIDIGLSQTVEGLEVARQSFGETIMNIIPANIFEAFTKGNMLSIIFFAIIFGFFITKIAEKPQKMLTNFFNASFEVMMKITMFVIRFTPLGILGIVAGVVSEQAGDNQQLLQLAGSMGYYMMTVLLALAFHAIITLPLLLKFIGKSDPWLHFKIMRSTLLTAFSTSSSGATLSLTMQSVEHRAGVSNKITSFTLPLGATINMDGTALYECVAAMFIAQAYGIELSMLDQIVVVITALLASIGAAGIPMAGLVMITIILTAVGLPLEGVGLILAVDRILDMFRTSINVWSDSCGAVIIAKSEGEKLNV